MKKIWLLTKVQLRTALDFNSWAKKGSKSSTFFFAVGGLFGMLLMFLSFLYTLGIGYALKMSGLLSFLPEFIMAIVSIITLATSIYKVKGILFGFKDYDLIMALPVKTSQIVISRFLLLYIVNLVITTIVILPASIAYGILAFPSPLFYILTLINMFFLPLVPMVISYFIGLGIAIVSQRFKYSNFISIILTIGLIVGILFLSFMVDSPEKMGDLGEAFSRSIDRIYFLAKWYYYGVVEYNILYVFLFIGVSVLIFSCFTYITGKNFKKINTVMNSVYTKGNYKLSAMKQGTPLKALYKKELKRYFSSSLYVLNTAAGLVMVTIGTIASAFVSKEQLAALLDMPGAAEQLGGILPLGISFMVVMTYITGCSISLEGSNLWILKTSPVTEKIIFLSKIFVNLTITIPVIILNGIILILTLRLPLVEGILLILLPIGYSVMSSILGLIINLHFPNLKWTSETTVIKQSVTSLICIFSGFFTVGVPFGILMANNFENILFINGITLLSICVLSLGLYQYLIRYGSKKLQMLGG